MTMIINEATLQLVLALVAIIELIISGLYYRLDKRVSKLEDWCNPFFGKMYQEAVDRVLESS